MRLGLLFPPHLYPSWFVIPSLFTNAAQFVVHLKCALNLSSTNPALFVLLLGVVIYKFGTVCSSFHQMICPSFFFLTILIYKKKRPFAVCPSRLPTKAPQFVLRLSVLIYVKMPPWFVVHLAQFYKYPTVSLSPSERGCVRFVFYFIYIRLTNPIIASTPLS